MIVSVRAHPGARKDHTVLKGNTLHMYLTEPARENRANKQLLRSLRKMFGQCKMVRGANSRDKLVDIPVKDMKELKVFLSK